jgi:hypothetical protein
MLNYMNKDLTINLKDALLLLNVPFPIGPKKCRARYQLLAFIRTETKTTWHQIKALSMMYQLLQSWCFFLVMYLLTLFSFPFVFAFCFCNSLFFSFCFSFVYLLFGYLLVSPFNISTYSKKNHKRHHLYYFPRFSCRGSIIDAEHRQR